MDKQLLLTWGINLVFAMLVAISYVMYGLAFHQVGDLPAERSLGAFVRYGMAVLLNPYFVAGLALALGGSLVRLALFSLIGIARSALVAELSLLLMLVFSFLVFQEAPRFPRDYIGGLLIFIGSYIVAG